jgi:hypothetical protein
LALKDGREVFQEGETIGLVLSFTSTTKNRYWADVRNYDRSGRLEIERYCVEPEGPDPLAAYFRFGAVGGGLGTTHALDATPFTAEAELNEWRSPGPGRYRVYAISYRVWRPPDPNEQTIYGHIAETVRSNAVEFIVRPATAKWQREQLQNATETLLGQTSPDDARRAARGLRFLNTKDSTRQLAKLFWGLNQQPGGWDLMFGLYGSPYRQLAIDSMRAEFAVPDHAITNEFLQTLVGLEESADPSWDLPAADPSHPEAVQAFWRRRQAHTRDLMKAEMQSVAAALPHKTARARALTLHGLLMQAGDDPELSQLIRPALIAAWKDLPISTQEDLIQYRWPLIAGPEMLPILRRILTDPPQPAHTTLAMQRDAVLLHINELDPALGRTLILRELENVNAQPSMKTIELLPPEDIAVALKSVVDRIARNNAREVDYELLDRYADASALPLVRPVFEQEPGIQACQPRLLRYVLRVDPTYGATQVNAALKAKNEAHCHVQFQSLGDRLPPAQQSAIDALDDPDPELVQDAVLSLGFWGTADAESALWARLERFHQEWAGRAEQLRVTPDYQSPGSRGAGLEEGLVYAIGRGTNWICPPDKLARLEELVWTNHQRQQIESWIKAWKGSPTLIGTSWFPEERPTFSVLQYGGFTEDQLVAKLTQFPRGTQLLWEFWQPGEIAPPVTMAKQEAVYERMRAVAEKHGITLGKANHP